MQIQGYDAEKMRKVLAVVDSVSPLNGMVCIFVDYDIERMMTAKGLLWSTDDGDIFEDSALVDWRRDGDVRQLAEILDLEIEITL